MSHSQLPPAGSPPLHSNNTSAFRTVNSPPNGASPHPPSLPQQAQLPPPALTSLTTTSTNAAADENASTTAAAATSAASLAAQGRLLNSNAVGILTSPVSIRSQLPPQQQQQAHQQLQQLPPSSQPPQQQQQQIPNVAASGSFIRQQTPSRQSPLTGLGFGGMPPPQRAISHHHSQSSTSLVSAAAAAGGAAGTSERSGTPLTASQMHASLSATRKSSHMITPTSASGASGKQTTTSVRPASVAPPSPSPPQSERSSPVPSSGSLSTTSSSQHAAAANAQQVQIPIFSYALSYAFPLLNPPPQFGMVESNLYRSARFNDGHYTFLATLGLKSLVWLHNPELHPLSNSMRAWATENGIEIFQPGLQAFPISSTVTNNSTGDKATAVNVTAATPSGPTTTNTALQGSSTVNAADAQSAQVGEYDLSSPNLSANFLDVYSTLIRLSLEYILNAAHSPCLLVCSNGVDLCSLVVGCLRRLQKWSFSSTLDEFTRYQSCLTIREPKKAGAGQRGSSSTNSSAGALSNASAAGGSSSTSSSVSGTGGSAGNASFAGLGRLKYHQAQSSLARDQTERMEQIMEIFDVKSVQLPDGANGKKKNKQKKQLQQQQGESSDKKESGLTEQKEESIAPAAPTNAPSIVTTPTFAPTALVTSTASPPSSSTRCVNWFRKMKSAERKEERAQRRERKKQLTAAAPIGEGEQAVVKQVSTPDSVAALNAWSENLLSIYSSHQLVSQQVKFDKKLTLVDEDED